MTTHNYIFLTGRPQLQELSLPILKTYHTEFSKELEDARDIITYSYATLGLKARTNIMLWFQADNIEIIQDLLNRLLHTRLGQHLEITHTLLGITRPTKYSDHSPKQDDTTRKGGKYLIIYPFTKTHAWYLEDFAKRKELMKGHIAIGRNYPQITQLLLYSFGIDDSEFIVSYETDNLSDFQNLVMELRSDKVRAFTLKDTPIFSCIYKPIEEALLYL